MLNDVLMSVVNSRCQRSLGGVGFGFGGAFGVVNVGVVSVVGLDVTAPTSGTGVVVGGVVAFWPPLLTALSRTPAATSTPAAINAREIQSRQSAGPEDGGGEEVGSCDSGRGSRSRSILLGSGSGGLARGALGASSLMLGDD